MVINDFIVKAYIELIMTVPIVVIFYTYLNEEDMLNVIYNMLKFILSTKLYVYIIE